MFTTDTIISGIKARLIAAVKRYQAEWWASLTPVQLARTTDVIGQIAVHVFNAIFDPDSDEPGAYIALAFDTLRTDALTSGIRAADRIGDAWARAFGSFIGKKLEGVAIPFNPHSTGNTSPTPTP